MSVSSHAIFILLSLVLMCSPSEQRPIDDNTCRIHAVILCVRDELATIKHMATAVARVTVHIERHIKQTKFIDELSQRINTEMNFTLASLPSSHWHTHLFQRNNIDKEYLTRLLLEAHDAVLYLSNTIDDLRHLEGVFGEATDDRFEEVQRQLRVGMVCGYRNVLHVYARSWMAEAELAGRMQFSGMNHLSPSQVHDVRSVVIGRHVRWWMEMIVDVLDNVETKLG